MRWLSVILFTFLYLGSQAHPSWGIVINDEGEVYFTDVMHNSGTLWRIDQNQNLYKALTNFHAHDLFLDQHANLWLAENLWIEGKIEGEGKHSLIKINKEGQIDTLIVTRDRDIFSGTSFAITPDEAIYFTNNNKIYQYSKRGAQLAVKHQFKNVKSIMIDEDGVFWIADSGVGNGTLYRIRPGKKLELFADQIMPLDPKYPLFKEKRHQFLIGMAKDGKGNIYISENAGCRIVKINQLGEKSVFHQSSTTWSPMNVAFYKGDAYILEAGFSKTNKGPRVIKKSKTGAISRLANIETAPVVKSKGPSESDEFIIPTWFYFGLGLLAFALIIILSVRRQHKIE